MSTKKPVPVSIGDNYLQESNLRNKISTISNNNNNNSNMNSSFDNAAFADTDEKTLKF